MAGKTIRLTRAGYEKLRKEYEHLTTKKRREIAEDLEKARAFGDLRENAEYDSAKNRQAHNEKRIAELNEKLSRVEILDETGIDKDKILLGATATLEDLDTGDSFEYMFVAAEEADFDQNKISIESPIGRSLLGHKVGDQVNIEVPAGMLKYKVIKIER